MGKITKTSKFQYRNESGDVCVTQTIVMSGINNVETSYKLEFERGYVEIDSDDMNTLFDIMSDMLDHMVNKKF